MSDSDALRKWMRETGWWQAGPCVVCGGKHFPLSMGGPRVCPYCDCYAEGKANSPYREGMRTLEQISMEFQYCMELAIKQGIMETAEFELLNDAARRGEEIAGDAH